MTRRQSDTEIESQALKSNLRCGACTTCTWLYDAFARRKKIVFSLDLNVSNDELREQFECGEPGGYNPPGFSTSQPNS